MKKLCVIFFVFLSQQCIASDIAKNHVTDIYMITPNIAEKANSTAFDMSIKTSGGNKLMKLDDASLLVIQSTIRKLSNTVCTASDNITKYTFTINVNADIAILGGSSGLGVEVQCK